MRAGDGKTVYWDDTEYARKYGDCVGQNIFAFGSEIWVVLSVSRRGYILTNENRADEGEFVDLPLAADAIVIGKIDTSKTSGTFGKFSYALLDISVEMSGEPSIGPVQYVSVSLCDYMKTFKLTINVKLKYSLINLPKAEFVKINGDEVIQVFDTKKTFIKAYTAEDTPFCTKKGLARWKLALIIALPTVAILTAATIYFYFKNATKKAAAAKMEKFKQPPTSPNTVSEAASQV